MNIYDIIKRECQDMTKQQLIDKLISTIKDLNESNRYIDSLEQRINEIGE